MIQQNLFIYYFLINEKLVPFAAAAASFFAAYAHEAIKLNKQMSSLLACLLVC